MEEGKRICVLRILTPVGAAALRTEEGDRRCMKNCLGDQDESVMNGVRSETDKKDFRHVKKRLRNE